MVACFHYPRVQVQVSDVLVCCTVSQEDTSEVVSVELAPTFAGAFHAYSSAKELERGQVRLASIVAFEGCPLCFTVGKTAVQVD